jgi:hypothetical protein
MGAAMADPDLPNAPFVQARMGAEFTGPVTAGLPAPQKSLLQRAKGKPLRRIIQYGRDSLVAGLARALAGERGQRAFREGLFRQSGEPHRWMYDELSLSELLRRSGFERVTRCEAHESAIADFGSFELDVVDGRIRKPDSLFVEGMKPSDVNA